MIMIKWEYKFIDQLTNPQFGCFATDFEKLGNDGWELIMVKDNYWIFKRQKVEDK